MESFGAALAGHRRMRGLSQRELARRMDIDPSAVCRWESGDRDPERESVRLAADALGLDAAERDRLLMLARFLPDGIAPKLVMQAVCLLRMLKEGA